MKTLGIVASHKKYGNSYKIIKKFLKREKNKKIIWIKNYKIKSCQACLKCKKGKCIIKDDFLKFIKVLKNYDKIIISVPIYFTNVPSEFKKIIDRTQVFYLNGSPFKNKKGFILINSAQKNKKYIKCTAITVKSFLKTLGIEFKAEKYFLIPD